MSKKKSSKRSKKKFVDHPTQVQAPTRGVSADRSNIQFTAKWSLDSTSTDSKEYKKKYFKNIIVNCYITTSATGNSKINRKTGKKKQKKTRKKYKIASFKAKKPGSAKEHVFSLARSKYYPNTGTHIDKVWIGVYGQHGKKDYPEVVSTALDILPPAAPQVSLSLGDYGRLNFSIKSSNSDSGQQERYDTRYWVERDDNLTKRSKKGRVVLQSPDKTMMTNTAETINLPIDISDWQSFDGDGDENKYIRLICHAEARGLQGNTAAVPRSYIFCYPAKPTITGYSVGIDSGILNVSLNTNSAPVSYITVENETFAEFDVSGGNYRCTDTVQLEICKNSRYKNQQKDISSIQMYGSWESVGSVDNAACEGLVIPLRDCVSDPGKHTWIRVHATKDDLSINSDPIYLEDLDIKLPSAADEEVKILNLLAGDDGQSAKIDIGVDMETYSDEDFDSNGTEISWSDSETVWDSTDEPSTYNLMDTDQRFVYSDEERTSKFGSSIGFAAHLLIRGLSEGTKYFMRSRRFMTNDDGDIRDYGPYTDVLDKTTDRFVTISQQLPVSRTTLELDESSVMRKYNKATDYYETNIPLTNAVAKYDDVKLYSIYNSDITLTSAVTRTEITEGWIYDSETNTISFTSEMKLSYTVFKEYRYIEVEYVTYGYEENGEIIILEPKIEPVKATVLPVTKPSEVVLNVPSYLASGQDLSVYWTFNSSGNQTGWRIYYRTTVDELFETEPIESKILVEGTDNIGTTVIPWDHLSVIKEELNTDNLSLYLSVTTGGDWAESVTIKDGKQIFNNVQIVEPPVISVEGPDVITDEPVSFSVMSDQEDVRLIVNVVSMGVVTYLPDGEHIQYHGDSVYSLSDTIAFENSVATITVPVEADFYNGGAYEFQVYAVNNTTGLRSDQVIKPFSVNWAHTPGPADLDTTTLEIMEGEHIGEYTDDIDLDNFYEYHRYAVIIPGKPVYATQKDDEGNVMVVSEAWQEGDVCDIYRHTIDGVYLVASNVAFGSTVIDRYAPYSRQPQIDDADVLGYIIVSKAPTGAFSMAEFNYKYYATVLRFDWDDKYLELPYNVRTSDSWSKDVDTRVHLDGSRSAYWNKGVERSASLSTDMIKLDDPHIIARVRELAQYPGAVNVRTPEGASYPADVQVDGLDNEYNNPIVSVQITANEISLSSEFMADKPGDIEEPEVQEEQGD